MALDSRHPVYGVSMERCARVSTPHTSFVAVPAFILVLPVTTSPPTTHSTTSSQFPSVRKALGDAQAIPAVKHPIDFANPTPPRTHGVRPLLAMPMTLSSGPRGGERERSVAMHSSRESSAPSTG